VAGEASVFRLSQGAARLSNTWPEAFLAYDLISCQFVSSSIAAWREPSASLELSRTFSFERSQDTPTRDLKEDSEIAKDVESGYSIA
jgi:hypothetical protein